MFRPCVFLVAVLCLIACSRHQAPLAPKKLPLNQAPLYDCRMWLIP